MVFLNRSIFRTTGNPTTTCRFFCARIEIETDPDLTDDLPTAARGALMTRCLETRSFARNSPGSAYARKFFPALSEGAVPDRSRELAPSAIAKHRIHYEAAARADRRLRLNMKESASVGGLYSLRFLLTLLMIGHIPILARHLR